MRMTISSVLKSFSLSSIVFLSLTSLVLADNNGIRPPRPGGGGGGTIGHNPGGGGGNPGHGPGVSRPQPPFNPGNGGPGFNPGSRPQPPFNPGHGPGVNPVRPQPPFNPGNGGPGFNPGHRPQPPFNPGHGPGVNPVRPQPPFNPGHGGFDRPIRPPFNPGNGGPGFNPGHRPQPPFNPGHGGFDRPIRPPYNPGYGGYDRPMPNRFPWNPQHRHIPYNPGYHERHYGSCYDYYRTIPYERRYIHHNRWIVQRAFDGLLNSLGLYYWNSYPYYLYNGYMYRYSSYDYCDYDLIDQYDNYVVQSFSGLCSQAYDRCADLRDNYNYQSYDYRYICAEPYYQ